ncbi:hypothetical protein KEF85_01550 [Methylomonas paludis]|uniref:Uncharacterized protein n=1 Tax=Methylomonas paludis TaxID=1173101 RepID=A0A975R884_9GAMM|nr:hypothetical protein [Methylomonas paludis]QWF69662.1 hypothetical protein KEF85_09760 [Methylomonas paludis]QWF71209.1 hypothetical protein KEF85_01550 [Methylomonas paludis]
MNSTNNPAQIEHNQSILNNLHQSFAGLAFCYGMTAKEIERNELTGSALVCLQSECEALAALVKSIRASRVGGVQ